MLRYLPFLLVLAVWIFAFIDCLNTPEKEVRKLPKVVWVIIILLFGQVLLGPIAWFVVGRPRKNAPYGATRPQERRWVAPDDNPEFLKSLKDDPPGGPGKSGGKDGTDSTAGPDAPDDARIEELEEELRRQEERQEEEARRKENGKGPEDPPSKP